MKQVHYFVIACSFCLFGITLAGGYALHVVRAGDSIGAIANSYHLAADVLRDYNDLSSNMIYPGQIFKIPYVEARGGTMERAPTPPPGFRQHILAKGETLTAVMELYGISLESLVGANPNLSSLDRLPVGVELLIPPPEAEGIVITLQPGETLVDVMDAYRLSPIRLAKANAIRSPKDVKEGMMLFLPGLEPTRALERLAKVRERENRYVWPVHGRITSYFGRRNLGMGTSNFHRGIDVAAPYGTPIVASRSGTVTYAGWSNRGYGNLIRIEHAGHSESWYGHNSKILVTVGQFVNQGEIIGRIGSTGISTGPHLHFEIHEHESAVDPLSLLR